MARMIPAVVDPSTASDAERKVFAMLQSDPDTCDWVVLHSLGLASRGKKKPYGEIDFVVLIPELGICCLEIKGGRVACSDGVWTTVSRTGKSDTLSKSPFMQVRDGMFTLRRALADRREAALPSTLPFSCGVIFPDVPFDIRSPEWEQWQIIDRDDLTRPISRHVRKIAREQRALERDVPSGEPSLSTIATIKQLFRPDFEVVVSKGAQINECEERILSLTTEQYGALDILADNRQCLVKGAAGTGKTMLALEFARRAAAEGNRTLLVCFNRLLGEWLAKEVARSPTENLRACRYHQFVRELITHSELRDEFLEIEAAGDSDKLYGEAYPTLGQLAAVGVGRQFDVLVMDEAQDLVDNAVIQTLDELLVGGIESGRWAFFGDFERQAIFGQTTAQHMEQLLRRMSPSLAIGRLKQNCRNTRYIAEETAMLSGFESMPYKPGQVQGLPVDYRFHRDNVQQVRHLTECVEVMLKHGLRADDIVILSRFRFENSCARNLKSPDFSVVASGVSPPKGSKSVVRFVTIHSFKGMESAAVVLIDVDQVADAQPQQLLYVAMSRARSHLTMLINEDAKPAINECLRRSFTMRSS